MSDDPIESLRRACGTHPEDEDAWSALAAECFGQGRMEEAETALREGIAAMPRSGQLHFNLARLLRGSGRGLEAETAFEQACVLDPDDHEAWMQLGSLRYARFDHRAAAEAFQQAASLSGADRATALRLAGFALADGGQPELAVVILEELASRSAGYESDLQVVSQLLFCRLEMCDWHDKGELVTRCRRHLADGAIPAEPFTFLLLGEIGPEEQLALSRRFCEPLLQRKAPIARQAEAQVQRRLRIGYFGDIFREHATALLVTGMIERHDHGAFEIHAFSYGPDDDGDKRRRLVAACDGFHDLSALDGVQTAAYIRGQALDMLIDLNGWTGNTRSAALAWRPAPVQINWLGYPATLGSRQLADYLIGDATVTPPEAAGFYAEALALMPHCYQPNDRSRSIGRIPSRSEAGLPASGMIFCCFNRFLKISEEVFDTWCGILDQVPGAVLWLLDGNARARERLLAYAGERGIALQRLVFAPPLAQADHLARLSLADLVLDTFPYGAHTTASDALWCGVPVLTRMGRTFSSRVAASLLRACGLDELITESPADYRERAVALARDPVRLAGLRAKLADNRLRTPLFDTDAFARDFEALLQRIWQDHCAGGGAKVISLEPPVYSGD